MNEAMAVEWLAEYWGTMLLGVLSTAAILIGWSGRRAALRARNRTEDPDPEREATMPLVVPRGKHCLGFLFNDDYTRVALIWRRREWPRQYEGVGGPVLEGETPDAAMENAFEEATGVEVKTWFRYCDLHREWGQVAVFFAADSEAMEGLRCMTEDPVVTVEASPLPRHCATDVVWLVSLAKSMAEEGGAVRPVPRARGDMKPRALT